MTASAAHTRAAALQNNRKLRLASREPVLTFESAHKQSHSDVSHHQCGNARERGSRLT